MNEEVEKVESLWKNPIPGLAVNCDEKEKIKSHFQSWATHFQRLLLEKGLDGLIEKYKGVVHNIKTQTCPHTKGGSLNAGDAFFECCGVSYEYFNDISVRQALQIIIDIVGMELQVTIVGKIEEIDKDLMDLIVRNEENKNPSFDGNRAWWSEYLPFGVKP